MTITRIRQEHKWGCQVAVAAMILGVTYSTALGYYPNHPDDSEGFPTYTLETILCENGYAIARKFKVRTGFRNEERPVWPPEPFSDIHWCQVQTIQGAHAVIMLKDGTVIDPACDKRTSLLDPDYISVSSVAAVVRLHQHPSSEGALTALRELRRSVEDKGLARDPTIKTEFDRATVVLGRGY